MKKKQKLGLLSMLLCAALLFGLAPSTTVQAAEDPYAFIQVPVYFSDRMVFEWEVAENRPYVHAEDMFTKTDGRNDTVVVPFGYWTWDFWSSDLWTKEERAGTFGGPAARYAVEPITSPEDPSIEQYSFYTNHKDDATVLCDASTKTITLNNFNCDYSVFNRGYFETESVFDREYFNTASSAIIEAGNTDLTIVVNGNCTITSPYGNGISLLGGSTLKIVKGSEDASLTIKTTGSNSALLITDGQAEFYNEVNLTLLDGNGAYADIAMAGSNIESRIHNTGTINGVGDVDEDEDEDEDVSVEESEDEDEDDSDSADQSAEVNWENTASNLIESMTSPDAASVDTKGNMNVTAGEDIEIPQNVLDAVESSGTTLALQTGKGLCFSISKRNLTNTMRSRGLNLNVTVGQSNFPDDVRRQYTEAGLQTREFGMEYRGSFGGVVNVHFSLGSENAGKLATLYSYTEGGRVTQCGVYRINEEGQAMYGITYGANYLIVIR